jgi:hypothetical protein
VLAIGVETEYRFITRSLSKWVIKESSMPRSPLGVGSWGHKGEPNTPIAAGSEVTDFLGRLTLL